MQQTFANCNKTKIIKGAYLFVKAKIESFYKLYYCK